MECSLWGMFSSLRTSCQIRDGQAKVEKIPVKVLDAVVIHNIPRVNMKLKMNCIRLYMRLILGSALKWGKQKKKLPLPSICIICLDVTNIANTVILANAYPQLIHYRQQGDESGGVK